MLSDYKFFDSHLHIIEPGFPLISNNGFVPDTFSCEDYLERLNAYDLAGGAIVSGSFQGFDQTYLCHALQILGNNYVGVTQLPVDTADQTIHDLHEQGVRAVRFNLYRGGSEDLKHLTSMAQRIYDLHGWHIELYVDSNQLDNLFDTIVNLPKVSIDHLGLSTEGFTTLLKLVEKGVFVKATGFSRGNLNIRECIQSIYNCNPSALMFGSDLPSTRAPVVYRDEDFLLVIDELGEAAARQVLCSNALSFYQTTS